MPIVDDMHAQEDRRCIAVAVKGNDAMQVNHALRLCCTVDSIVE